ncbi:MULTISPECIES: xanthine phosphoribosyltransferase [Gammaproteobacteria]|uniref:xanthine phosphoribosyltransferase n=1 Tax=Gammaproteobacteria TaxID=1236 RepID=UPI000DCF7249|nr:MULTISPECIES: xanthine phosphoribosyltransferase [Gammaproteobacteria]RTE87387.1 xanthine phosphoribosyltransferase [Aliidiomarina sp. B3213]TCZ92827.1 xanthine phosphoribosyltransferase [Lysobacter sp. N42]
MSQHDHKEYFVSWEELHRATRELARRQLPAEQWKGVIAVTRGGLVPAAILSRELNLRVVDTVSIRSYMHQSQQAEPEMLKPVQATEDGEGFIVIDDLVDSGNTLRYLRKQLPKAKFITVYAKPAGLPLVDDYEADIEQTTWIHFPWDMRLHYIDPLAGHES